MLTSPDRLGTIKARWGIGRMHYTVDPGLYALGTPDGNSPVLVTANYKMSFDRLRSALPGRNAWLLILDTNGINVWCAAGKGTFGTRELAERVKSSALAGLVSHRNLIVPQLGAPGIAAHLVRKLCGFSVIYGPVEAKDLPAFLDAGMKATAPMRFKNFPVGERAALIPMELIPAMKWTALILPILFLLAGIGGVFGAGDGFWPAIKANGAYAAATVFFGLLAGAVMTPLLLPWLPGKALSAKGGFAGALIAAAVPLFLPVPGKMTGFIGLMLAASAFSAFLGMNFTGATTYTSLSGVRKEMRWAVPVEIAGAVIGLGLWIGSMI